MSAKSKINSIEVLISKALIVPVISHDEFTWTNNVLKEYNQMKEEIQIKKRKNHVFIEMCSVIVKNQNLLKSKKLVDF